MFRAAAVCNFEKQFKHKKVMKTPFIIVKVLRLTISFVCIFIVISTSMVDAQNITGKSNRHYMGFGVNFGNRSFNTASDYAKINGAMVSVGGGQLGITWGNNLFRADLGLIGYYSSVSNIAGTIDLYTNHLSVKFYPSNLFSKRRPRLDPYISTGLMYDRYKFYGHYTQETSNVNYSAPEPYLGCVKETAAMLGAGLEFRIIDEVDFVHFFSEVKWSTNLTSMTTTKQMGNTHAGDNMIINVGLSFGYHR
jgi:hypothetical protein